MLVSVRDPYLAVRHDLARLIRKLPLDISFKFGRYDDDDIDGDDKRQRTHMEDR